jgi:methyl-accepting chemotaxis protein
VSYAEISGRFKLARVRSRSIKKVEGSARGETRLLMTEAVRGASILLSLNTRNDGMRLTITIGKRFIITSGVLLLLCATTALVALFSLNEIQKSGDQLATDAIPGILYSEAIRGDLFLVRGEYLKHISEPDPAIKAKQELTLARDTAHMVKDIQSYQKQIFHEEDREKFAKIRLELDTLQEHWQETLPLSRAGKSAEAYTAYKTQLSPSVSHLKAMLDDLVRYNTEMCRTQMVSVGRTIELGRWVTIGMSILAAVIGIGLSWWMIVALNKELKQTIAELLENSAQIASAAGLVASSSHALAEGSSEQAATIEETSCISEDIKLMARRNAESSRTATGIVNQSEEGFRNANRSLDEMVGAMDDISASSQKIAKIIKVIDAIAFQTNILALNAAVEAARAGETGMGLKLWLRRSVSTAWNSRAAASRLGMRSRRSSG